MKNKRVFTKIIFFEQKPGTLVSRGTRDRFGIMRRVQGTVAFTVVSVIT